MFELSRDVPLDAGFLFDKVSVLMDRIANTPAAMRRVTTFQSTTDRIYDGGHIRL
jgi:hypothetical protein